MNSINESEIKKLEQIAYEIRVLIIKTLTHAQSGHSAGSLGMADIFTALYFHFLKVNPAIPSDPARDRLLLSSGHICPALYITLAKKGFFPEDELYSLRKINSRLQGHPHNLSLPGIESSSGPLGQGISNAVGQALYLNKINSDSKVVVIGSDGELDEGQSWEACLFAPHHKIRNLIWIVDRNNIQIGGNTTEILDLNPLSEKFKSFGWEVLEMDGNKMEEVCMTISQALDIINQPVVIIASTVPGKGVDFMEYQFEWHGKAPSKEQEKLALESLEKMYLK